MTGYGKASGTFAGRSYTIDLKTLNGKVSDLRLKIPTYLRSKEIDIRKTILKKAIRGKIDCTITIMDNDNDADYKLNVSLFENYINQLSSISEKFSLTNQDLLQTVIRIPNVVQPNDEEISDEEEKFIMELLDLAMDDLNGFRSKERKVHRICGKDPRGGFRFPIG